MIHMQQLGISLVVLTLIFVQVENAPRFSKVKVTNVNGFNKEFASYCNESEVSPEIRAVLSSFYGDYESSLLFASVDAKPVGLSPFANMSADELKSKRQSLEKIMADSLSPEEEKKFAASMLTFMQAWKDPKYIFKGKTPYSASDFIVEQAKKYHFLLINEAHYSSQNREFTRELLKPLWDAGYRYLALEALSHNDKSLTQRGYPIAVTGYYIQDAVFGNLVRDALKIGYKLIPYETTRESEGTERDSDQAITIYNNTIKKDQIGKVLIHAGYSHISEATSLNYEPLGAQLKKLVNTDILTVDQESMLALPDSTKVHPYQLFTSTRYNIQKPVVFLDADKKPLVDPLNASGIDIQVYHPQTKFVNHRPTWRVGRDKKMYKLPESYSKYRGCLLQAMIESEDSTAVPIDEFIIKQNSALVLPLGEYLLRIINCEGILVGTASIKTN